MKTFFSVESVLCRLGNRVVFYEQFTKLVLI